ncbi:MAG: hypothetical protein RLZZ516_511 [Cyanobacteriota bacterium]|jgi:hypothetical protein
MSPTTPRTNAAPSTTIDPAAANPAAATPAARRAPIDPLTGMPEPAAPAAAPLGRDLPAPPPTAAAELPPYLLPLSGAGVLLGGLALLMGITVYLQLRRSHGELSRQIKDLRTKLAALDLDQTLESLAGGSSEQPPLPSWPSPTPGTPPTLQPKAMPVSPPQSGLDLQPPVIQNDTSASSGIPPLDPVAVAPPAPAPILLSKAILIQALNNGDRQLLREHTTAQLNITSESENALAMGRSQATQLEAVTGGGSYWLAVINDQAWLFPTELTLKGFLSVQPSKGLYSYEKQILSKPELLEPALLRQEGNRWTVETLGRVAIP